MRYVFRFKQFRCRCCCRFCVFSFGGGWQKVRYAYLRHDSVQLEFVRNLSCWIYGCYCLLYSVSFCVIVCVCVILNSAHRTVAERRKEVMNPIELRDSCGNTCYTKTFIHFWLRIYIQPLEFMTAPLGEMRGKHFTARSRKSDLSESSTIEHWDPVMVMFSCQTQPIYHDKQELMYACHLMAPEANRFYRFQKVQGSSPNFF